ncbi:alpha/beta fold hydrolase [Kitasatospora sp. MAA4]|uniref:alpha/beta fold hydrolase n=1 Tax=Kitasatospora sp. MAA4 TaxID=3035093 RepID=UPI0024770AAE|nr:alpha/beta fold hydrolase [Kitasatospora sp. MAA4]
MATATQVLSHGVRQITLDGDGIELSALLSEPEGIPPRAVVVALHGAGMSAGYFDGQASPGLSLLTLGARLGFTVLAVDRPGYGRSTASLPEGQSLADQARTVRAAVADFTARYPTGAGLFLLAHSFGGKLALTIAAQDEQQHWLGVDVSGCGHQYAVGPGELPGAGSFKHWRRMWGPLRLYPPNTFQSSGAVVAPTPEQEQRDTEHWPLEFPELASRIQVPVRFTFAEHESWWHHDSPTLADLSSRLTSAPRVLVDRQPSAGHNISLGFAARSYHLRALGFLEDCLLRRDGT